MGLRDTSLNNTHWPARQNSKLTPQTHFCVKNISYRMSLFGSSQPRRSINFIPLQFLTLVVSLSTASSNENFILFMALFGAHVHTFPQLLCLCCVSPIFRQSAILVARIDENHDI